METPFNDVLVILEYGIVAVGALLVVTSFMRLGWFGTWHGETTHCFLMQYVSSCVLD